MSSAPARRTQKSYRRFLPAYPIKSAAPSRRTIHRQSTVSRGIAELFRPRFQEIVRFFFGLRGKIGFGDVVQLRDVEQRAAFAHFIDGKFEIGIRRARIFQAPFFEIRI